MESRISLLPVLLAIIIAFADGQESIVQPNAKGSAVVEAVCSVIEASCIFADDKLFTRRLAYVESYDGEDDKTFRQGYYGGIWQVIVIHHVIFTTILNFNSKTHGSNT